MDNIDSSIQYCNRMVQGGVSLLNASTGSGHVVCVGTKSTEAKVIDLNTGMCGPTATTIIKNGNGKVVAKYVYIFLDVFNTILLIKIPLIAIFRFSIE